MMVQSADCNSASAAQNVFDVGLGHVRLAFDKN